MKALISTCRAVLSSVFLKSGWDQLRQADVLVARHDADCGYQYNGKAYSPIIDSIVEMCSADGFSVQSFATPFSRLAGARAFNSPIVLNRSFLWIALLSRMLALLIGRTRSKEWVASRRTQLWLRVLERVKPRLVIGIQPDVYLCRACRMLNVLVYDIQHGVIDPNDKWYGELLKSVAASDLPTGFLCWNNESARILETCVLYKGATVCVVGHPWFQRFQYPDRNDRLVQEVMAHGFIYNNEKPTILVSLQWGLHIHYYPESDFNKIMCKALETVIKRTHGQYNWLLRLHPVQLRGEEGRHCESYLSKEFGSYPEIEWYKASRLPLPLLFSQVNLHITDMSTVVIEASWLGIPSALLNPFLNKGGSIETLYEHERRSGMARVLVQDVGSIESWIEEKLQSVREISNSDIPREGVKCWLKRAMMIDE